jgi:hypothetical protein
MGELQAHLDLGTADTQSKKLLIEAVADVVTDVDLAKTNSEIAESIDALLKTMSEIDQASADLLSGAEAQIAELAGELEASQSGGGSAAPTISLSVIDAELERRGKASNDVGAIQERLEDEQATLKAELAIVKQRIQAGDNSQAIKIKKREIENKLAGLEPTIASIIEAVSENDEKVRKLIAYKNAVQLIGQGIPRGIVGEKLFDFRSKTTST